MAFEVIPGINIAPLTGPMILGFMWSYCLYGVLLVQLYMYLEMFPSDRKGIKLLVWTMFFFETFFTVLMTLAAWDLFGSGWGNPAVLLTLHWSWGTLPLVSGVLSGLAQGFYIWRIWHLTKQLWLPLPIALVMLAQLIGLWWFGLEFNIGHWTISVFNRLSPQVTVWLGGSAVCDVLITMALTFIFWRKKKASNFAQTSGVLNRLIRLSIETGLLTSVTATVETILWVGWHQYNYHFTLFLMLGKLYSNVLMATLNCRNPIFLVGSSQTPSLVNPNPVGTIQTSFWSEPHERLPSSNVNSGSRGGVHISRNVYVDDPNAMVMTDFNISANHPDRDDLEKGLRKPLGGL
ncbi:hypothetical protein DFH08DRAFT_886173 [Mycena albidolilacea]|uniref:DUF6534 domain-containing protein n=1 Tax=Mycena albidolilacea TaxID=1033008 RepID=A0AAD6ZK86_9AGAR|nr:hypothetical protein DFH08DRAFT_886173 [Mycena albidolilacea]